MSGDSNIDLFAMMDRNGNGDVSLEEVQAFCESFGPAAPTPSIIARLFVQADTDSSGQIDKLEFSALCEGLKMLSKMTEAEMAAKFSEAELRRVFNASGATNGQMRREELRTVFDTLNQALNLKLTSDSIAFKIRKAGTEAGIYVFEDFLNLLNTEFCPGTPLLTIVDTLAAEETKRRERLMKVKSLWEGRKNQKDSSDFVGSPSRAFNSPRNAGESCKSCQALEETTNILRDQMKTRDVELEQLRAELQEKSQQMALDEVHRTTMQKKLEAKHQELQEFVASLESDIGELRAKNAKLKEEVMAAAADGRAHVEEAQKRAEEELSTLTADCESYRNEVEVLKARLEESGDQIDSQQQLINNLKDRLKESEESQRELENMMQQAAKGQDEANSFAQELKRRCYEKEAACTKREAEVDQLVAKTQAKEKELRLLQDKLQEQERGVRQFDADMHKYWDTIIENAVNHVRDKQVELEQRELELVQQEAELVVRVQLFEKKMAQAEQTSLPERQRRLSLLQQIERDLCERERCIRRADAEYLQRLANVELTSLREENERLKESVRSLETQLHQSRGSGGNQNQQQGHGSQQAINSRNGSGSTSKPTNNNNNSTVAGVSSGLTVPPGSLMGSADVQRALQDAKAALRPSGFQLTLERAYQQHRKQAGLEPSHSSNLTASPVSGSATKPRRGSLIETEATKSPLASNTNGQGSGSGMLGGSAASPQGGLKSPTMLKLKAASFAVRTAIALQHEGSRPSLASTQGSSSSFSTPNQRGDTAALTSPEILLL
jgi:Ca2+-binding EF-hand superfamily protein